MNLKQKKSKKRVVSSTCSSAEAPSSGDLPLAGPGASHSRYTMLNIIYHNLLYHIIL